MTESPRQEPLAPMACIDGRYVVESVLGRGGHGTVYAVRRSDDDARLALKLLDHRDRADAAARLTREARAVAALGGEHLPRLVDVGETEDGRPFLVMERLEGETLAARLSRTGPLSAEEAASFAIHVCAALCRAHARGIVHRDLKPSNLFVDTRQEPPTLKVLDFGIAKVLDADVAGDPTLTATGTLLGSPRYMAPEQIRDAKTVDPRCDIWSLGVVLFELVSGAPPFDAATVHALCAQIAADPPGPLRADIPPALRRVIERCLSKDPDERPQSAAQLAAALAPVASPSARALVPTLEESCHSALDDTTDITADLPLEIPTTEPRLWLPLVLVCSAALVVVLGTWARSPALLQAETGTLAGVSASCRHAARGVQPAPAPASAPPTSTPRTDVVAAPAIAPRAARQDDPLADRR